MVNRASLAAAVSETEAEQSIREYLEQREAALLHPAAVQSRHSAGREKLEEPCPLRTAFQRDRDRVLHSKAFRRLNHKTQVFIAPVGDHFRTRLTHSIEVAQVSRTIARALGLNEDLTESIALGHDLGHPPFGHAGETILNELHPEGFHHQQQSVRVIQVIEELNLSKEVIEGIEMGGRSAILEAQVEDLADRMAYLHHDVEDARRAGLMTDADLPEGIVEVLGTSRRERLNRMVSDLIASSRLSIEAETPTITMSNEVNTAMMALRQWMFEHVYLTPEKNEQLEKVRRVLTGLYNYFTANPDEVTDSIPEDEPVERRALDFIAGMTDRYAIDLYKKLMLPNPYQRRTDEGRYR